jgi:hypothetical protein
LAGSQGKKFQFRGERSNLSAMIFVSAISSSPRRRESRRESLDSRLRGNDVYVVAECMIKANLSLSALCFLFETGNEEGNRDKRCRTLLGIT